MMRKLRPTQTVRSILDLDLSRLLSLGKHSLIFDLDGTLCRKRTKTLDVNTARYIANIQSAGFRVGILTNRRRNADDSIVRELEKLCPVVAAAAKPRREGFTQVLAQMGTRAEESVMIGDKRLTDIWGANRVGMDSILVRAYPLFT